VEFQADLRTEIAARNGSAVSEAPVPRVEPAAIDWGRVLDNFGPEGVAALIEQLGISALGCYENAPNP
jgi:hypothetical protein